MNAEAEERANEVKALGGLKIIGTERHESRRIDNQLRGRAGRQGDPGESRFYISLEDDLMRLFGSERMMGLFKTLGLTDGAEIHHRMLSSVIEKAQKKIEDNNFGIRKNLLEYDRVNNEQREIIYEERRRVLDGENMREYILKMARNTVERIVSNHIGDDMYPEQWDMDQLNEDLLQIVPIEPIKLDEYLSKHGKKQDIIELAQQAALALYEEKEKTLFPDIEQFREAERVVLLNVIDRHWMNHIDDMDQLRQGIGLQSYGQRDPVQEYKFQGYEMFENMINSISEDTIRLLMNLRVEQKVERKEVAKITGTNKDKSSPQTSDSAEALLPRSPLAISRPIVRSRSRSPSSAIRLLTPIYRFKGISRTKVPASVRSRVR